MLSFKNSAGETKSHSVPWLWTLLWAPIYFAVKGVWLHAIISLILASFSFALTNIIYAFFAARILRKHYTDKGWEEVKEGAKSDASA